MAGFLVWIPILCHPGPARGSEAGPRQVELARGQALLDDGANRIALQWADSLFSLDPSRLEILDLMMVAAERLCSRDSVVAVLKTDQAGRGFRGGELYLEGATLRNTYEFEQAAEQFGQAARSCLDRADTLSAVAAFFNASSCLRTSGDFTRAQASLDSIESIVPVARLPKGWDLELGLRWATFRALAGDNTVADTLFSSVLAAAKTAGYRGLVAQSLAGLGAVKVQTDSRPHSLPYYEESLAEAEILGDVYHQCRMLINLAYNMPGTLEGSPRGRLLDEAEKRILACGHLFLLGHVDETRAVGLAREVRRTEAIALFRSAAEKHAAVGNRRGEIGSRQRMGYNLAMQGRFLEARDNFEKCLELMRGEEKGWLANWVLWGLANVHRNLGDLDTALEYYERVVAVGRGLGSMGTVAWNLSEMGLTQALLGRYRQAILLQHEALDILDSLGRIGTTAAIQARIGDAYYHLGDLNLAREHYRQSWELSKKEGGQSLSSDAVGGLALIFGQAGDHAQACDRFGEALAISRRYEDHEGILWALVGMAEQQILAGRRTRARISLEEARSLLTPGSHFHDRARIGLLEARLAGDPSEAALLATDALEAAREGGLPADEWECLSDLGENQAALGDTAGARQSQAAAIEVVESLWLKVGAEELQRHFLGRADLPYERMIGLLLATGGDEGRARDALQVVERGRSRVLFQRLAVAGSRGPEWMGGAVTEQERETAAAIALRQTRLQEADLDEGVRTDLKAEIRHLEQEYRLLKLVREDRADPGSVLSVQDGYQPWTTLNTAETAAVFSLGSLSSYLFTVRSGRVRAYELPARNVIEERVRLYLSLWDRADRYPEDFQTASRVLFQFLFGPAAADIRQAQELIIVPDGLLHRLPFPALLDDRGHPLGERDLVLAPSLGVLERLRTPGSEKNRDVDVVAIGCGLEASEGDPEAGRVNPFTGDPLVPLPWAESEAQKVSDLFRSSAVLTGNQATEAGFRDLSGLRAGILHVAAHGVADEKEVRRSFLVLNPPEDGEERAGADDGILQWYEIADLNLNADLVTLSSCRSASGVLARGEGITGLAQAFLFAGARCVLATSSDVPDHYTAAFMGEFYGNLKEGLSAAAALSETRQWARREGFGFSDTPLWAAFTLIGDGTVKVAGPAAGFPGRQVGTAVVLASLAAGLVIWSRRRKS